MLNVPLSDAVTQMLLHVRTLHASAYKGSITVVSLEWTCRCCDKYPWALILPVVSEAIFGVIFTDFIEQISLTNCAIQIRSDSKVARANTALGSS